MPDLKLDLGALESMRGELRAIVAEFQRAEQFSHDVAGTVGHPGLAAKVDDFAGKWNIHRKQILDKLVFVSDSLASIHDTFTELDERLASQLERTMENANKPDAH